ncbi:MAG: DUF167 domain-containing protein [Candidatus Schekmanbacteria bacterium]|nr:MAG: DUF167 domain-containing protein [Candidatus Schekmanbacteria bacterium]
METVLKVKVIPKSSKKEIVCDGIGGIKVKVNVPPIEGKANKACIELLAQYFKIPKSKIEIIGGTKSRNKIVRFFDIENDKMQKINDFLKSKKKKGDTI